MLIIRKKNNEGVLEEIATLENDSWVELIAPDKTELKKVIKETGIPEDFFTDPLDINERARVEIDDKWTLIILRVPHYNPQSMDVQFTTLPLGIVFSENQFFTICSVESLVLKDFLSGRVRNFSPASKNRFILQIFLRTAIHYLNYLKEINQRTNTVEKELHKAMKNEELIHLLNLEKSLVYFTTSLKSNEIMMERLQRMELLKMSDEEKDFLEDTIVENKQAIEMANIYSNILSGMMDAFASVISNNLTVVMKLLTSITIILMLPTLVASIYGMNVRLPFQESTHAFWLIMGISLVLSVVGILIFIKRKWF